MTVFEALAEIGDWMREQPGRAAVSSACVLAVILVNKAMFDVPLIYSAPPTIACFLLGLHIRLQLGDD